MVTFLLGLLRASREGNWDLHVVCIHYMLLWSLHRTKSIMHATLVFIMLRCLAFTKYILIFMKVSNRVGLLFR